MQLSEQDQVQKLTDERDRARHLAAALWDELEKTQELVERLNAQIEVLTGKEQNV